MPAALCGHIGSYSKRNTAVLVILESLDFYLTYITVHHLNWTNFTSLLHIIITLSLYGTGSSNKPASLVLERAI